METQEVISRIKNALAEAEADIRVDGADCNFTARVISENFAGMRPVQRQQQILQAFKDVLADGRLHALTVDAVTPAEWQARSADGLTRLG